MMRDRDDSVIVAVQIPTFSHPTLIALDTTQITQDHPVIQGVDTLMLRKEEGVEDRMREEDNSITEEDEVDKIIEFIN